MQEMIDFLAFVDVDSTTTANVSRQEGQYQQHSVKCQQLFVDFTAAADDGEHRPGHG